jgi:hypothetical protein
VDEPNEPKIADDTQTASDEIAIRRRRALERLGKMAIYSTPLVVGLLSSDAWSESG